MSNFDMAPPPAELPPPVVPPGFHYALEPDNPTPPPAKHTGRTVAIVLGVLVLLVLAVGGTLAATHKSGSESGGQSGEVAKTLDFNDPTYLANDIKTTMVAKAAEKGYSWTVTKVGCIKSAALTFICHMETSTGETATLSVTVAEDGQTWISKSAD